jgi:hypothetical protein
MSDRITIESHSWITKLLDDNKYYVTELAKNGPEFVKTGVRKEIELAAHQFYAAGVIEAVRPIYGTLERIGWASSFLKGFPNARSYERQGITRDRWIEYHYAYFVVAYSSFFDLSLRLVNQVFRLGIPPHLCKGEAVLKNSWLVSTSIPGAVKEIEKLTKQHQGIRNVYVHGGKVPDIAEVLQDDLFHHLSLVSFTDQFESGLTKFDRDSLVSGYRFTSGSLRRHMQVQIKAMDAALAQLFSILEGFYRQNLRRLSPVDFSAIVEEVRGNRKPVEDGS